MMMKYSLTLGVHPNWTGRGEYQVLFIETERKVPHWGEPQENDVRHVVLFSHPSQAVCEDVINSLRVEGGENT